MSNDRLIDTIEHYKRNIIRACANEELTDPKKVVYCLDKLSKLPISVQLLSITGIGRTVNELRKFEGTISEKAKLLVTLWKSVVKAEEDKQEEEEEETHEEEVEQNVNGYHHNSSTSGEDEEEEDDEPMNHHDVSDDEDPDKENEREEENDAESEDEKQRRLKFEEEKKAYEEYLRKKQKKITALNGHDKNSEEKDKSGRSRKSDNRRKENGKDHKKEIEKNGRESSKSSQDKHDKDRDHGDKDRTKSGNKSNSSDKDGSKSSSDKDKSKSSSYKDKSKSSSDKDKSKSSSGKDKSKFNDKIKYKSSSSSQSSSKYSNECNLVQIKKEKIDKGYEKNEKRHGSSSDKTRSEGKESKSGKRDREKNGKESSSSSRREESRDDKARHESSKSSSSSSIHKERTKQKHPEEPESGSSKRSKTDVKVKQEPVTSEDEGSVSSNHSNKRDHSSSRESSVSSSVASVKKEKTESSSKHRSDSRPSEPKKMKLVEATDGGFADALLSIVPTAKKSSAKKKISSSSSKKHSSSSSEQTTPRSHTHSPGGKSSRGGSPASSSRSISPTDLLSGNVKLEPLDKLDIASTLPEISPDNYFRPHLYQSPDSNQTTATEASHDDLCRVMTSKNQRTKVFSGSRVVLTKVPSLFDSCIRILKENIDSLEYTGGVPYDILRPVLERATAEQLYQLEHYNPYLMEDTGKHWEFHANRDFRGKKLQEYETWRELYIRCMAEREKKLKEVRQTINLSKKQSVPLRTTKLAYVDSSFVKPPRQVARQQARHGTGSGTASSVSVVSNANKAEVIAKASVGGYSSGAGAAVAVAPVRPGQAGVSAGPSNPLFKKKKAPLMMKALQSFKGFRKR